MEQPGKEGKKKGQKQADMKRLTVSDLRRGVLLQEILGPPRALKPFQWTLFRRR
ncbi:hypothetical protein [Thermoactinomyces mirandus]|uniref:Uncharacterized protein n=1 Tax=Thermoactinomyces mirandus TaxID=2756294 RepID=A0A7W2AQ04_9BACL|nr:hypothetical protein [Thermoactinomyces mirandus]MBA4600757.1 hypothetical protein [Thermoactinomyces mirandus]